jgi:hypothetical protein
MLRIDKNKNISLTRGDIANINVMAKNVDGTNYTFKKDDVVRLNVFDKKDCSLILLKKDVTIEEETTIAKIQLTSTETKIGELITKPIEYWYEIVLNPNTAPQTIVGYLDNPTIFKLLPEGGDNE